MMPTSLTKPEQLNASIEADPFLFGMPEKDYVQISLDETPLPMPDELPPECNDDDFECLEVRASLLEKLAAQKEAEKATHGAATVGAADQDQSPINLLKSVEKKTQQPTAKPQKAKRRVPGAQAVSPGRAMREACFQSAMFFPRKILMVGHWAHDLKLGNLSGRKVIGILSVGCLILLVLLMIAALLRSNSLRGLL